MKSVLISIRPELCKRIANGKKTIEVRKTNPKLKTPFKCYIYCIKDGRNLLTYSDYCGYDMTDFREDFLANGRVIGEFICEWIRYCWYISNLTIYDRPRELSEFGLSRGPLSWCYVKDGEG